MILFPLLAAFRENAFQQFGGGFLRRILGPPLFGQLAFDGSFEHGRAVSLQIGLGSFKGGHAGVEVGEEFFDLGDDAVLFVVAAATGTSDCLCCLSVKSCASSDLSTGDDPVPTVQLTEVDEYVVRRPSCTHTLNSRHGDSADRTLMSVQFGATTAAIPDESHRAAITNSHRLDFPRSSD